jgi:hypothetical protein
MFTFVVTVMLPNPPEPWILLFNLVILSVLPLSAMGELLSDELLLNPPAVVVAASIVVSMYDLPVLPWPAYSPSDVLFDPREL